MGEESPKNKVKFLCSHGGKVLPRPSDGVLKYVGGETRVICVPRDVTFSEVMKKVSGMVEGEVVLKYQLVPEDLDTLVSVRNDEDLKHMIEEYDRHESAGASLLRAFLFPFSKPPSPSPSGPYLLEQRYIDAINGIIRTGTSPRAKQPCSACSSPKSSSPDGHTATIESPFPPARLSNSLHKVRSSPSLTNLNNSSNNIQQHDHSHNHHHLHPFAYPSPPRQDAQVPMGMAMGMGMGRPPPLMTDMGRGGGGGGFNYYYPAISRPHKPYAYQDDNIYGPVTFERVHSVPRSPRKSIWE